MVERDRRGLGLLDGDSAGADEMGTATSVAVPIARLALLSHATGSYFIETPDRPLIIV